MKPKNDQNTPRTKKMTRRPRNLEIDRNDLETNKMTKMTS